jgi:hypothetical protein
MSQPIHGIAIKTCPQCGYRELIDGLFLLDSAAYPIRYGHQAFLA